MVRGTSACPFGGHDESAATDQRLASQEEWRTSVPLEKVAGVWRVSSQDVARQILRSSHTVQAGFQAEQVRAGLSWQRHPVLFLDGPEHRAQRKAIARFFSPAVVESTYRELMDRFAADLIHELDTTSTLDLGRAAMGYSVRVAATIVGLKNSNPDAMGWRLMRLFGQQGDPSREASTLWERIALTLAGLKATVPVVQFAFMDVLPAVRARRRSPESDVISHLLEQGYSVSEITIECLTYAAAGMVTTREFISMAAWHFFKEPQLRARYVEADQRERYRILYEVLRLEPVVGQLYRRTTQELKITHGGETTVIPAGEKIVLSVMDANADSESFECPRAIHPDRELPPLVRPEVLAFGDGAHRCPGHFVAIQESDIFLRELFRREVTLRSEPQMGVDPLIAGYRVENMVVGVS